MHRTILNKIKRHPVIFLCPFYLVIQPCAGSAQDYDALTDALIPANHVQSKSKMRPFHNSPYETYLYNRQGLPHLYLRYQEEYLPDGARPMMATDYYFDSTGRLNKKNESVVEDFRREHLIINQLGTDISESMILYNYNSEGKIIEEKCTDVGKDGLQTIYDIRRAYQKDGSPLSRILTDSLGRMRVQWLYFKESGISRVEQSRFDIDGQKIFAQTTWYEKPGIPLRILTNDNYPTYKNTINTTYKNTFNKKGQLVKVLRRNPTKNEMLLFSYLKNGLLEKITGPENSPETFEFTYSYFPGPL